MKLTQILTLGIVCFKFTTYANEINSMNCKLSLQQLIENKESCI